MEEDPSDELHLLTQDAAKIAQVSGQAIRMAQKEGRIRAAHTSPSGVHVYHFSEVLRFASARDKVARLKVAMKQTWKDGQ